MEKKIIGYQVVNDNHEYPTGVFSFQVFRKKADADNYCAECNRNSDWSIWSVIAIKDGDIEDPSYIERFMDNKNVEYVTDFVRLLLKRIFDDDHDCNAVCDSIIDDVISDICETADDYFNSSDIEIALARVLKKRIGVE